MPLAAPGEHSLRVTWVGLVGTLIAVVMFIPIRRYGLPGNLPFELEPYRLLVVMLILGWTAALLVDQRVTLRSTGVGPPLLVLLVAVAGSIVANPGNVAAEQTQVAKSLTFLLSFLLIMLFIVSVVRTREAVDGLLKVLVACGSVVAVFAIVESRTGFNLFNELSRVAPFLSLEYLPDTPDRGARLRVFASAQHSIALSAALVMLVPLAGYLAVRTRRHRWWAAGAVLLVASVATLSRTGVIMLLVVLVTLTVLRPRQMRVVLPFALPLLVAVHLFIPGALGSLQQAFTPEGGLVTEQRGDADTPGSGRVADLSPALSEAGARPVLGQGYGTRVVDGGQTKDRILDNQWLGTLLEIGVVGVVAFLWLFGRTIRRLGSAARRDPSDRGLLLATLAASITAFAVGMFTYDAFSFIQVTYIMFVLVALSAVLLQDEKPPGRVLPSLQ